MGRKARASSCSCWRMSSPGALLGPLGGALTCFVPGDRVTVIAFVSTNCDGYASVVEVAVVRYVASAHPAPLRAGRLVSATAAVAAILLRPGSGRPANAAHCRKIGYTAEGALLPWRVALWWL